MPISPWYSSTAIERAAPAATHHQVGTSTASAAKNGTNSATFASAANISGVICSRRPTAPVTAYQIRTFRRFTAQPSEVSSSAPAASG